VETGPFDGKNVSKRARSKGEPPLEQGLYDLQWHMEDGSRIVPFALDVNTSFDMLVETIHSSLTSYTQEKANCGELTVWLRVEGDNKSSEVAVSDSDSLRGFLAKMQRASKVRLHGRAWGEDDEISE